MLWNYNIIENKFIFNVLLTPKIGYISIILYLKYLYYMYSYIL
jgi:hypothetical protein